MTDHSDAPHSRAAIPLAPSLDSTLAEAHLPRRFRPLDRRVLGITLAAMVLGAVVAGVAWLLTALIGLITNLAFYGRWDTALSSPAGHHLGLWVIAVPVVGGLIVGVMARWGSRAIRGHGIPEAMEQILLNESRIPPRMTWLKPVSSAVAIGTGGPFGAEGPIIATGGALGSLLGQLAHVTADERKTLLAAGAAAGMAAVFSAPVSAVLLSIELLLFERRARSLIPVALAAFVGTGVRYLLEGNEPMFPMPDIATPTFGALAVYVLLGLILGVVSVGVTKLTYAIEDGFEKLPIHWMWWPAIGGLAVGVIGYFQPLTLGVGYANITAAISGQLGLVGLLTLCIAKLASWSIALGSGTSGGTLAPLFTIGSTLGGAMGLLVATALPALHVDPRLAALVCMAPISSPA
jgi:H+/Cl- antiporter ClcA